MQQSSIAALFLIVTSYCLATSAEEDRGCPTPHPLQGGVFLVDDNLSSVEYKCRPDMTLVGSNVIQCKKGQWSSDPPVCVGTDCHVITVNHATVISSHHGGIARVKCRRGFRAVGPALLACIEGRWNSTDQPKCVAGSNSKRYGSKNGFNPTAAAAADPSIAMSKMSHEELLEKSDYSCVRSERTVLPPSVRRAHYSIQWAMRDGMPRLYATYQCHWGHVLVDGRNTVYCQQEQWIGKTPNCQYYNVTDDNDLQSDADRPVSQLSHKQLLSRADYTCIGSTEDGNIDPPKSEHAMPKLKFTISNGKPHLYAKYTCEDGYALNDHKHMYCRRRSWIGTLPSCVEISMADDRCLMNNGGCQHLCVSQFGVVTCSCKQGFALEDDKHTCSDVDECDVNNADCQQMCDNIEGGFSCSCYNGFHLHSDRTSCVTNEHS